MMNNMCESSMQELKRIVNLAKLSLIEKELKGMGYVDAQKTASINQVNLQDIVHSKSKTFDDVYKGNLLFRMTIYEKVKNYEEYTWVWLEVLKIRKKAKRDKTPFPEFEDETIVYFPHDIILYAKINGGNLIDDK